MTVAIGSGISAQLGIAAEVYTSPVVTVAITGTPTGGTFTVTINGATTSAIAYNATAATVASAIQVLDTVQSATTLTASGGPLPGTAAVVTMGGVLTNGASPTVSATSSLAGGSSPAVTATVTTQGSGYATYATPTRFLEMKSESLNLQMSTINSAAVRAGNRVMRKDRFIQNKKGAAGPISLEFATNGFGQVLQMMTGTAASPTTPANGVLARQYTFMPADMYGQSWTIQLGRPNVTGNVTPFTYVGSKVVDWSITGQLDAILDLSLTIDAQDEVLTQSLASASYPTSQSLFSFTGAQVTVDGGAYDTRGVSFKATNGIKTDRYLLRGDSRKREPIINAMSSITGSLDMEFQSTYTQTHFNSSTAAGALMAVTATWTGSLIETVASPGPYYQQLQITVPFARVEGDTPNVAGPDVLTQSVPFTALWDGTTAPITIVYTTTDTSL